MSGTASIEHVATAAEAPAIPAAAQTRAPASPAAADLEIRFHRYVLGLPTPQATAAGSGERALLRKLQAGSSRFDVHSLPRLPAVLPQLLHSLKSDSVGGAELAQLISHDPVLVGEVMRVSGSTYYRTLHPIQSLQHAVILLGQDGLRRVVTQHVMKPILHFSAGICGHVAGQRLWEHAERCAHACAYLARQQAEPFGAYLAGIVCHTGTGALVRALDAQAPIELDGLSDEFLEGYAGVAAQLSLCAAQHWQLPAIVLQALAERCEKAASPSPLGTALQGADRLTMIHVLVEHGVLPTDVNAAALCPGAAALPLARCRQDLQRYFVQSAPVVN